MSGLNIYRSLYVLVTAAAKCDLSRVSNSLYVGAHANTTDDTVMDTDTGNQQSPLIKWSVSPPSMSLCLPALA